MAVVEREAVFDIGCWCQVGARHGNIRIPPDPESLSHSRRQNSQLICKALYLHNFAAMVALTTVLKKETAHLWLNMHQNILIFEMLRIISLLA
jgi:hypothetical protein